MPKPHLIKIGVLYCFSSSSLPAIYILFLFVVLSSLSLFFSPLSIEIICRFFDDIKHCFFDWRVSEFGCNRTPVLVQTCFVYLVLLHLFHFTMSNLRQSFTFSSPLPLTAVIVLLSCPFFLLLHSSHFRLSLWMSNIWRNSNPQPLMCAASPPLLTSLLFEYYVSLPHTHTHTHW